MFRYLFIITMASPIYSCALRSSSPLVAATDSNEMPVIREFKPDGCSIERIYVNPKFSMLGIMSVGNGRVETFDLATGAKRWSKQLTNFSSSNFPVPSIRAMAFSSTGEWTFFGGTEMLGKIQSDNGELSEQFPDNAEKAKAHYSAVGLSPDDQALLAVGSVGRGLPTFDIDSIGISPQHLARAQSVFSQVLQLWNTETGRLIRESTIQDSYVREVGFSKDRSILYTASYSRVAFFRLSDLQEIAVVDATQLPTGNPVNVIISTALSRNLRFVAISTLANVYVVSTESHRVVANFAHLSGSSTGIAGLARHIEFSDDDSAIQASDLNGRYYSWEVQTGKLLSYGYSPRGDIVWSSGSNPHPLIAFDPGRQFVLEPVPISESNTCPGIRLSRLPPS